MDLNINEELAALRRLTIRQLHAKYAELFGHMTNNRHRVWLIKRMMWRLQALAEGDLTERAASRAVELANDAELRITPPRPYKPRVATSMTMAPQPSTPRDQRLPAVGTLLVRKYKGQTLQVEVLPNGFSYGGQTYASLSAVARAITGSHCNGFYFFRITGGQR